MSLELPDKLKPYKRFIVQANQIQKVQPLIAYYCRLYVLNQVIAMPKAERDKSVTDFLLTLMDAVENDKKGLEISASEDFEKVKTFADNVFANADAQDRDSAEGATMKTAQAFLTSSALYDVLAVFKEKEVDAEVKTKTKYAKFKAADIAKSIKEGKKPSRGGPLENLDEPEAASDAPPPASAEPPPAYLSSKPKTPAADNGDDAPLPNIPDPPREEKKKDEDEPDSGSSPSSGAPKKNKPPVKQFKASAARVGGMGVKDINKIKNYLHVEELTREALSGIRFGDAATAKTKLQAALDELR